MATYADVERIVEGLPEITIGERHGRRTWFVGTGKKPSAFAWERPFSKADIKRFGDATPPAGDILEIGHRASVAPGRPALSAPVARPGSTVSG